MDKKSPRSTIDDVAREAGVSIATVSRVINQTTPVAEKTVERVLTTIETLNYKPQAAAQILASRKTKTIGLLLPEIIGHFFFPMILGGSLGIAGVWRRYGGILVVEPPKYPHTPSLPRRSPKILLGVESGAHENGYNLLIHTTLSPANNTQEQIKLCLGEHNTDGLILFAHSLYEDELRHLNRLGLPMVLLPQSPPNGLLIPNVTFENRSGSRKLVDHLIEVHNYRRMVFLAGRENHEDSCWR